MQGIYNNKNPQRNKEWRRKTMCSDEVDEVSEDDKGELMKHLSKKVNGKGFFEVTIAQVMALRTQTMAMPNVDIPQGMDIGGSPRHQETIGGALVSDLDSDFDVLDDDMEDVEGETVHTATTGVSVVSAPVTTAGVAISTAEPRTPPTTAATAFIDEDLTIAQTLIKMKEEKAKEKGVAIKDVEDSPRPIRSITTLQPLPTIDPKDKGKGVLVEEEPDSKDDVAIDDDLGHHFIPIVDWENIYFNENMIYEDVIDLHRLVNERYETTSPEGYDLLLWGDLKTLFEPNKEDEIWKNQQDYNLISWRLFDYMEFIYC
ncbi:hypothetical protein Tco_0415040 [Tanacetum coccineum]